MTNEEIRVVADAVADRVAARVAAELAELRRTVRAAADRAGYSTDDVAARLDVAAWTIRDWCNRLHQDGRPVGVRDRRGRWTISPDGLKRLEAGERPGERQRPEHRVRRAA